MNPQYEEITFKNVGFIGWPNVGKSSIINSIQEISSNVHHNDHDVELDNQDNTDDLEKIKTNTKLNDIENNNNITPNDNQSKIDNNPQ